jgi:hypothetical protein
VAEVVYRSRLRVVRGQRGVRTAELPAGEEVRFGVHSEVAAHYGRDPDGVSTTLDYVVAAACG